jgi:hypothetical protein
MSKLSPPATSTEPLPTTTPSLPLSELRRPAPGFHPPRRQPHPWAIRFAAVVRWLHIYVSLLGFTALMFFAVTGITLNHPTWFGAGVQHVTEYKGTIPSKWLKAPTPAAPPPESSAVATDEPAPEADPAAGVAKLEIVEHLRQEHQIRGAVSEFRADDVECMILFKGPGYSVDVFVDRASGDYTATQTAMGVMAIMNDLHKGRDSGAVWSWVIDITAGLMVFVSITGFVLLFYLRRKRFAGTVTAVIGTIVLVAIGMLFVP